jgi:hypothetical protein
MIFLALLLGVAVIGGVVVGAAVLSSRGTGSREGPSPNAPLGPPPTTDRAASLEVPADFGWARLNEGGEKSVGYYYRDRVAGRSFHVLFMEPTPLDAAQLREKGYRGNLTKRLGAHETMQIPEGPARRERCLAHPDDAEQLRGRRRVGDSRAQADARRAQRARASGPPAVDRDLPPLSRHLHARGEAVWRPRARSLST